MRMPSARTKELMVANATTVAVRAAIAELDAAPGNVLFEKDIESQEKLLSANNSDRRDENDFEKGSIDTSEATSDPPTIGNNNNTGNLLTNVNYTTKDSLNPFPEIFVVDNQLKSNQEENCKVLNKKTNSMWIKKGEYKGLQARSMHEGT